MQDILSIVDGVHQHCQHHHPDCNKKYANILSQVSSMNAKDVTQNIIRQQCHIIMKLMLLLFFLSSSVTSLRAALQYLALLCVHPNLFHQKVSFRPSLIKWSGAMYADLQICVHERWQGQRTQEMREMVKRDVMYHTIKQNFTVQFPLQVEIPNS